VALNRWDISCGVDAGAIRRSGNVWTFRTSTNHCERGIFAQRAALSTEHVPPDHRGAYLFRSDITMTTSSDEPFDIFQIHDGRRGCAPPLKVSRSRSLCGGCR